MITDAEEREHERVNAALLADLRANAPDQLQRVLAWPLCDIEPMFLGFVHTYEKLAREIPRDWTVLDLGCAYAAQSWFFRKHKAYVGVDFLEAAARFQFANGKIITGDIRRFLDLYESGGSGIAAPVFAILNYVPAPADVTRRVERLFPHRYVYYPESSVRVGPACPAGKRRPHSGPGIT